MTRHLKKPQGLRTSKIGITINANGLAWFRRYLEAMLCIAAVMRRECPLWVKSRHQGLSARCPLYPRKQTLIDGVEKATSGQKLPRTCAFSMGTGDVA